MSSSDYDVIIIGTGAGGGTLAHDSRRPASASCCSSAATTCRASRTTGARARSTSREVQHQGDVARQGRQGAASAHQLLRRRQHQVLRRGAVPPAPRGLRRAPAPRRRLARLADRLRRAGAVLHRGRAPLPGARRARRGSDRAAGERAVPATPPSATSRASSSCSDDFARARAAALPPAARHHAGRAEPARRAAASAAPPATATRAWCNAKSDAQVVCVDPALEYPNVTLLTNAYVARLETSASGREVTRGASWSGTASGRRYTADIVVVVLRRHQLRRAAAALGQRRASARAGQRLRRRGSPLHGPHQLGADGAVAVPQPDGLPEDASR